MGTEALLDEEETKEEEATEEELEAAFTAGYDNDEEKPEVEEEAGQESEETEESEQTEQTEEQPPDDPLLKRVRHLEGKFGTVNSTLNKLVQLAETQTARQGHEAPTREQIEAATQSNEKFETLKEEFPEWAEAMTEQSASLKADIKADIKDDLDGLVSREDAERMAEAARTQARHYARLDGWFDRSGTRLAARAEELGTFGSWEEIVADSKFGDWLEGQALETQELADSPNASDAITLLDLYVGFEENTTIDPEDEETSQEPKRLKNAIPATKPGARARKKAPSEDDAFKDGFENG
jgi:hypothetical protein